MDEALLRDWLLVTMILSAPAVGSFIGLLADRYDSEEGVVFGRSRCDACGRELAVRDLVPLLSWVWLRVVNRGRSRCCGVALRIYHPLVELSALVLALWGAWVVEGWAAPATVALGWVLLALSLIDLRTFLLPDSGTLGLVLAGLGLSAAGMTGPLWLHAAGAAAGYAALWAVAASYRAARGVDGLGMGDAKLLAAAGAWLGPLALPSVVLWGGVTGLALAAAMGAFRGGEEEGVQWGMAIPFGPALAFGFWITWLYGPLTLSY